MCESDYRGEAGAIGPIGITESYMGTDAKQCKASLILTTLPRTYYSLSNLNFGMEESDDYSKDIDDNLIFCEGIIKETYDLLIFLIKEKQKTEPDYKHGSVCLGIQHGSSCNCNKVNETIDILRNK